MSFIYTTAIDKMRKLNKRIKIVQGGTSAGKTFGILPILIDRAARTDKLEISIVSESIPHLRRGALKDFIKIMQLTNRWIDVNYNKSHLKYTFSNGSYIEFFSIDQPDKLRGARRNILYINEANNVDFEAYQQLSIRTSDEVFIDFNPTHEFWAHEELMPDDDSEFIILTYKDNEALSESIVKEIEKAREKAKDSSYWLNWWNVYGLGKIGSLEGVVFDNWSKIKNVPKHAKYVGSGMDFGYTNDPTTLVDVWEADNEYIFNEVVYETGLGNRDIVKRCDDIIYLEDTKEISQRRIIYADSAEPKSIDEIYGHGIYIRGAKKGSDSIRFGISLLQDKNFRVTSSSLNLIKELRSYSWAKDRTGKKLNVPVDNFNHLIDAMRYWAVMTIGVNRKMDIR